MTQNFALHSRYESAEKIAKAAGKLALDYFKKRETLNIESKRDLTDLVSEADRNVEILIRNHIKDTFPEDGILGEEYGLTGGNSEYIWVIDPIDGTAPYLNGLPGWCVSIAVLEAKAPAIGAIYVPVLDEMFLGMRGNGATMNGAPLKIAEGTLASGLLGFGMNTKVSPERIAHIISVLQNEGVNWVRYGSGAVMLAWVAAGRLVGYFEPVMSAWDCMAAYLLISEAGGHFLDFPLGDDMTEPAPVLAGNEEVFRQIQDLKLL